jgi:hypothetical protein
MTPFTVQIPTPCTQSWDSMTGAYGGRRCEACQEIVVDFTQLADKEILAYFQQLAGGSVCGRFRASQVGRPLVIKQAQPIGRPLWLAGILATTIALQACDPSTRVAPHPPLAHTPAQYVVDSATLSDTACFNDSTLSGVVPLRTDSLIHDVVLGFTVSPETAPKSRP